MSLFGKPYVREPGHDVGLATLQRRAAVDAHYCLLDREKSIRQCHCEGHIKYIGEQWPGMGIRRRLGMCELCHSLHPLDVLEDEWQTT